MEPKEVGRGKDILMLSFRVFQMDTGLIHYRDGGKQSTIHYDGFIDLINRGIYKEIPPEEAALII